MIINFYVQKSCDIYGMAKIRFHIFVRKMISDIMVLRPGNLKSKGYILIMSYLHSKFYGLVSDRQ